MTDHMEHGIDVADIACDAGPGTMQDVGTTKEYPAATDFDGVHTHRLPHDAVNINFDCASRKI